MTTLRRALAVFFAMLVLVLSAPATFGHASLEESDPPDGGTIATPYVLVARYDEELKSDGSSIVVRDSGGNIVAQGGLSLDDAFTMTVELPALTPGEFVAHWIAITADDNGKTQGDITFAVVTATPSPAATPTPATSPTPTPPSASATAGASPTPTTAATATALPTPPPSPALGDSGQTTGSELIIPIVLVGAVVVGLAWFLLRRRPT
jgi:methionine-rich copper-binding protein CopC